MTPIEQLDHILNFMANTVNGAVTLDHIEKQINPRKEDGEYDTIVIPPRDINRILEKLVEDKYLRRQKTSEIEDEIQDDFFDSIGWYSVTWKGKYFTQLGGYAGELKEKVQKEEETERRYRSEEARAKQMTNLTIILAAGTTVAALYYVVKGIIWVVSEFGY